MTLHHLTDAELEAHTAKLRERVDAGQDDGCREYLIAAICEGHRRTCAAILARFQPERRAA